jgi:hypothetical protein
MALDAPYNSLIAKKAASLPCAEQAPVKLLVKESDWGE